MTVVTNLVSVYCAEVGEEYRAYLSDSAQFERKMDSWGVANFFYGHALNKNAAYSEWLWRVVGEGEDVSCQEIAEKHEVDCLKEVSAQEFRDSVEVLAGNAGVHRVKMLFERNTTRENALACAKMIERLVK